MSRDYKKEVVIFGLFTQYKRVSSWTGILPVDMNFND
jgi:hypothetical protein